MIHIEGMGWFGSVLAFKLAQLDVPFTWSDIDDPQNSWRASTGLVYPAGDERSQRNLSAWCAWNLEGWLPSFAIEPVDYLFGHKNPPHGGKWSYEDLGWARIANASAFSVNVPVIVEQARHRFAERRRAGRSSTDTLVVAHGSARAASYVWGWSVPVQLTPPSSLQSPLRPVFYGRVIRRLAYAYALPGTPLHLAGSTLVRQTQRKELDAEKHFARWEKDFAQVFPDVAVRRVGVAVQGWRPRPADDDQAGVIWRDGALHVPALWHSGVRWAPEVIEDLLTQLEVARA